MINVIIFGYGMQGIKLYREIEKTAKYKVIAFADNSIYKQGMYVGDIAIKSVDDLVELKQEIDFSIIIAANRWWDIGRQIEQVNIPIEGVYVDGKILPYERMSFNKLDLLKRIKLYAGDICDEIHMADSDWYGLSINKEDAKHILHDITKPYPLPNNCIVSYQAEDVLEHIIIEDIVSSINEIYRILKPGGLFRICVPDYYSPYLNSVSMKDGVGNIVFDPTGGGIYGENGVENGGHVWFPNYKNMKNLLEQTDFQNYDFLCYHTEEGKLIRKEIDFSKGYINRISQKEEEKPVYSIVVDCYK